MASSKGLKGIKHINLPNILLNLSKEFGNDLLGDSRHLRGRTKIRRGHLMTKALMASVALAALALAGCATDSGGSAGASAGASNNSASIQYAPPPPAPAYTDASAGGAGGSGNAALCASKGGSVSTWPDVSGTGSTQNCELANGSAFPLAQLTAFPEFQ